MSVRKLGTILAAVFAVALIAPVAAGAQTPTTGIPTTSLTHVPVSGKAHNGKQFTGHFDVTQFVTRGGKSYAVGTLTGKLGNRTVKQSNVAIPASAGTSSGVLSPSAVTPAATCPVLHLDLGPLNLNLLGLTVHLNEVVLDINAVPGAGNLLGNLLCSVSNLLNSSPLGTQQVTGLLNIVQQLLNTPGLLSL
jgi:hypothetical protein